MARQVRIEYAGAFYHVMARGDRREAIVRSNVDRELFVETLGETCQKTGWRIHAWVLMDNHYHWLLETPEPNLVEGMKWFQNTFTRRINSRHRLWGHVFGDRYKAVLVESNRQETESGNSYLTTLVDYIHLNPTRAGLVNRKSKLGLLSFGWSSLARGYGAPPGRRAKWMETETGLASFGLKDTAQGRRRFVERLEQQAEHMGREAGKAIVEGQTLNSRLERGWYWGSQAFREKLLRLGEGKRKASKNRNYRTSEQAKEAAMKEAEELLESGIKAMGLGASEIAEAKGSDPRKVAVARVLATRTTVSQQWIAQALGMKSAANVSQQVRRNRGSENQLPASGRRWLDSVKNC
jgi:putative transposase